MADPPESTNGAGARAALSPGATSPSSSTRLGGRPLRFARLAWASVLLLTMALFAAAVPARWEQLTELYRNLTPAQELVLWELGASGQQHALLVLSVEVAVASAFVALAILIVWRRSDDWLAMLVSAAMLSWMAGLSPCLDSLVAADPGWRLPADVVQALGMASGLAFFYVFPDGRFCPAWSRWLLGLWGLWALGWIVFPDSPFAFGNAFAMTPVTFGLSMAWWTSGAAAQIYRYTRVSSPVQRQQTKWILFGTTVTFLGYSIFGYERFARPLIGEAGMATVVYDLVGVPIFLIVTLSIPVAFAISILRYRLWDIDTIVSRALVYGVLTAVLGGLYSTSITFSQRVFVAVTGERSDAAIVLTTLLVASAFTPVRSSLQGIADRYIKHVPDPARSLRALSEQVRSLAQMLDIQQLTARALDEAVQAFGATCGAVYVQQDGSFVLTHVSGEWGQVEGMSAWLEHGGQRYGWIVLGPRSSGAEYSDEDQTVLKDTGACLGQAMSLMAALGLYRLPGQTHSGGLSKAARIEGGI